MGLEGDERVVIVVGLSLLPLVPCPFHPLTLSPSHPFSLYNSKSKYIFNLK